MIYSHTTSELTNFGNGSGNGYKPAQLSLSNGPIDLIGNDCSFIYQPQNLTSLGLHSIKIYYLMSDFEEKVHLR